jgi:dTMP kinase
MNSKKKGMFISIEGVDGSGKTTNVAILAEHLRSRGYKVLTTREPGGNVVGEKIRDILLHEKMDPVTELMLFLASRNEHMQKKILPHLEQGYIVLCDRFHDSTWAYQGYGRGMNLELQNLGKYVYGGRMPHITLFFDIPFEESTRRLKLRSEKQDRFDQEEETFRRKVYDCYQDRLVNNFNMADDEPYREIHRINALPEPDVVADSVRAWANANFENLN